MKKLSGIIILIMFAVAIFACSERSDTGKQAVSSQEQQQHTQEAAKAVKGMKPETASNVISGTVVHTDSGYTVYTDAGPYHVVGEDLSSVVGRKVRILGTIEESGGAKTITMESIVILE